MRRWVTIAVATILTIALLGLGGYFGLTWVFGIQTLTQIEKQSPDRTHVAKLRTVEGGFDVNVYLEIDGTLVYSSPDFAAPARVDFQEQVVWDRAGQIVVVELAGKRVFGYHVGQQRPLSSQELSNLQLASFNELRLVEDIPGIAAAAP